jgi:transcriptional regulator with XRE-family HTH domain
MSTVWTHPIDMISEMNTFAKRLRDLREEKGLSARQLAYELNFAFKSIYRWEDGSQIPNIEVAIKVAKYFGASADYLLGLKDF